MSNIPFDIPSFCKRNSASDFLWPIDYTEYEFLSYGLINKALQILDAQDGDAKIALTCKLSDIIIDINNLAQQALALQKAEESNHTFIYDRVHSPTCDWLLNSANSNDLRIIHRLKPSLRDTSVKSRVLLYMRQAKRLIAQDKQDDKYNTINFNLLMTEWVTSKDVKTFNLLTDYYVHGKPKCDHELNASIARAFQDALFSSYNYTTKFKKAVSLAIEMIIQSHLSQALGDLSRLKSSNLHKYLKKGLVSGTPKYEGRMLGWYFLEHGKEVIRFAHGGERVFYKDYAWPIAELPYCSQYYAHSRKEAENMKKRIETGQYAITEDMKNIKFSSLGSHKHQQLYKPQIKPAKNKTVVYATSVYEHDDAPGLPAFKTPDVLYFEFQARLLTFLKKQGWHIILKPHPKGLYQNQDFLAPYVDEIVKAPFDANTFKAEIFLFDFAGTAFFDTLATTQRVLLLNLAGRPLDNKELENLQKRCAVLNLDFDDLGRITLDETQIAIAMQSAPQHIDKSYIDTYAV